MVTLIILVINMVNIEPQQTVHIQKFGTIDQCETVGNAVLKLEQEQLEKRGALNKDGKGYQISFTCIK
jgi:hypothetical protein